MRKRQTIRRKKTQGKNQDSIPALVDGQEPATSALSSITVKKAVDPVDQSYELPKREPGSKGYGGGFVSVLLFMPAACWIAKKLEKTFVTPNQLTIAGFVLGMLGSLLMLSINGWVLLGAAVLLYFSFVLDCADGNLARRKGMMSKYGAMLDDYLDRIFDTFFFLVATFVAYAQTQQLWVWPVGMLALGGNMRMVALHLKLENFNYKGPSAPSLPLYRRIFNYGSELNMLIIIGSVIIGYAHAALIVVAVLTNAFTFARFWYVTPKINYLSESDANAKGGKN